MKTKITQIIFGLFIYCSSLLGQKGIPFDINIDCPNLPQKYGEITIKLEITPRFKCDNVAINIHTFGNIIIQNSKSWEESFKNKEKVEYQFIVSIPDNDTTGFEVKVQSGKFWHSAYRYFVTTGEKLKVFKGNPQHELKTPRAEMKIKIEGNNGQILPSELPNYERNKIKKDPENKIDINIKNIFELDTTVKNSLDQEKAESVKKKNISDESNNPWHSVILSNDKNENSIPVKIDKTFKKNIKTETPIPNKLNYLLDDNILAPSSTTIFSDNFGGSYPGSWSIGHDGGGGTYAWAWPSGYAHCYSNSSGGQYYYPDNLHVYMERRNVSLAGYSTATLSFNLIVDTEGGYDKFSVNVRDQNGSWHEMYVESGETDPLNWVAKNINMNQFVGQTGLYIQFRFDSDGSQSGSPYDGAFIDGVALTAEQSQPNLAPYTPSGWDYPIVPSSISGTHTVTILNADANTYINWAVINNGGQNINSTFYTALYIDNSYVTDWSSSSLQTNYYAHVDDYIRTLSEGWHNLKIVADYTGNISESNENDNSYSKDFYWQPSTKPNLIPYTPAGWDYPIVPSSIAGSNVVNSLYADQITFIDWCVKNIGTENAGQFHTALYIDDAFITSWNHSSGLQINFISYIEDYERTLSEGNHTLKIIADYLNEVTESNENDNEFSRQFYWEGAGSIVVKGRIRYHSHNPYQAYDAKDLWIEVWDDDVTSLHDKLWEGWTAADGSFTTSPIINSEILQGTQDIYLKIFAKNHSAYIHDSYLTGSIYSQATEPIYNIPNGTKDYGDLFVSYEMDGPLYIADKLLDGYNKWNETMAGQNPGDVEVVWPTSGSTAYNNVLNYMLINGENDPGKSHPETFDGDVILHEYGHRLEDVFDFCDNSEGGDHTWIDEISRDLAGSEGFAHFWSSYVRNNPTQYNWWMDNNGDYSQNFSFNLENGDYFSNGIMYDWANANSLGNDNEGSVAGMIWDLFDSNDDDQNGDGIGDNYNGEGSKILNVLINRNVNGHHPDNSDELYNAWSSAPAMSTELEIRKIWFEHGDFDIGLPVEITSFYAKNTNNTIELTWKTSTEVNNYGFEVERKSFENWTKIGFVDGNGTTNSPHNYTFIDNNLSGGIHSYRLKQIDHDGKFEYSSIVEATIVITPDKYELTQNYPNPFNPSTTIRYGLPSSSRVSLKIFTVLGQQIADLVNTEQSAGWYETSWNANVSSGLYFYKLDAVSTTEPNQHIIQLKKMMLVK